MADNVMPGLWTINIIDLAFSRWVGIVLVELAKAVLSSLLFLNVKFQKSHLRRETMFSLFYLIGGVGQTRWEVSDTTHQLGAINCLWDYSLTM